MKQGIREHINGYKKFKTRTKEQKFEYLYGLFWQNFLTGLLMMLLVLGLMAFAQTVNAEGVEPTYITYTNVNCREKVGVQTNGSGIYFIAKVESRLITLEDNGSMTLYSVSKQPADTSGYAVAMFVYSEPGNVCPETYSGAGTDHGVIDGEGYFVKSYNNKISESYAPVVQSQKNARQAIYYTYGEGAVEKRDPTFEYYCSNCQTFYYNADTSRYGNFQANTGLRVVYFNDRATFVSDHTFTLYLNTTSNTFPNSCGTNGSEAREYVYKGTTYYYLTFGKQNFEGVFNETYIDESGSAYKAIDYTYGENAVAPEVNKCSINYGNVHKMYPTELVRSVAEFGQSAKGMYYSTSEATKSIAIYNTRYDKKNDALYSYYLVFDQSRGQNTYTLTNDGFTMQFNNVATTSYGTTAIYDDDLFSGYTRTNYLVDTEKYVDTRNWQVYAKIYPDPSKAFVGATVFDNQYRGVYSPTAFGYTTLNFTAYDTGKENPYFPGENIKYYIATNETEDYYDYFVLLALNLGQTSNMSSIYNYKGGLQNEDGTENTTKQLYYALSFLGIDDVWLESIFNKENFQTGVDKDLDTSLDFKNQAALGISETEQQDEKRSKAQGYVNWTIGINENLQNEAQDYQVILKNGESNYASIGSSINGVFNNQLTDSANGVSQQVDYVYYNTSIRYFIDASMLFTLFMGVFF